MQKLELEQLYLQKLELEQLYLYEKIKQDLYINLVTCGNCSAIILHDMKNERQEINCHSCMAELELCDCPDLWYK